MSSPHVQAAAKHWCSAAGSPGVKKGERRPGRRRAGAGAGRPPPRSFLVPVLPWAGLGRALRRLLHTPGTFSALIAACCRLRFPPPGFKYFRAGSQHPFSLLPPPLPRLPSRVAGRTRRPQSLPHSSEGRCGRSCPTFQNSFPAVDRRKAPAAAPHSPPRPPGRRQHGSRTRRRQSVVRAARQQRRRRQQRESQSPQASVAARAALPVAAAGAPVPPAPAAPRPAVAARLAVSLPGRGSCEKPRLLRYGAILLLPSHGPRLLRRGA